MYKVVWQSSTSVPATATDFSSTAFIFKGFNDLHGNTGLSIYFKSQCLNILESTNSISKEITIKIMGDNHDVEIFYDGIEKTRTFKAWNIVYYPDHFLDKGHEVKLFKMNLLFYLDLLEKKDNATLIFWRLANSFLE